MERVEYYMVWSQRVGRKAVTFKLAVTMLTQFGYKTTSSAYNFKRLLWKAEGIPLGENTVFFRVESSGNP